MRVPSIALFFFLAGCGGEKTADKAVPSPSPVIRVESSDPSPAARAGKAPALEAGSAEVKAEAKLPNGLTKAEVAEKRKKINQRVDAMAGRVGKGAEPVPPRK